MRNRSISGKTEIASVFDLKPAIKPSSWHVPVGVPAYGRSFALVVIAMLLLFAAGCATTGGGHYYKPVTVPEIIQWSKDGVPSQKIIDRMRRSHTVYRLKASQLAQLKQDGVSDAVINYMQQTYLNAVRNNQALEDWSYWWPGWDGFWYGGPAFGWPDWDWGDGYFIGGGDEGGDEN